MKKRHLFKSFSKGFTLVEVLVTVAVIGIISTVVVYSHREFESTLELTNVAYRVAVSIREAQVYGISVKELNGSFNIPYGVSFYISPGIPDSKKSYAFFGDSNPNLGDHSNAYDGPIITGCVDTSGDTNECIERITLGRGNIIKKVCAFGSSVTNSGACIPMGGAIFVGDPAYQGIDSFSVVFKRPKSDAVITASKRMSGINIPVTTAIEPLTEIFICLQSPSPITPELPYGKNKAVHISSAGQISVEDVTSGSPTGSGICLFN